MTTPAPGFTITRTLNASPKLAWHAWTENKALAAWLPSTPLESIFFNKPSRPPASDDSAKRNEEHGGRTEPLPFLFQLAIEHTVVIE